MKLIKKLLKVLARVTFWGWNLIFIAVFYCGILPFVGIPLIEATFDGDVPLDFSITFLTLIIIPVASIYISYKYLRKQPAQLIRFFYGVEAPLVTWCLVRLFLIRELTSASALVLGTLFVTVLAFAIEIIKGYRQEHKVYSWLQMIAHSLMLLIGLYLGIVLLFYAIPVAIIAIAWLGDFIVSFFSFQWVKAFWQDLPRYGSWYYHSITWLLFLVLFGFSTTVFIGMPSAIAGLYINSVRRVLLASAQQYGKKIATGGAIGIISIWLILLFIFNQQPQVKAFDLLNKTPQDRQALLASSSSIKKGLINANLNRYRYLTTNEDNNHIFAIYDDLDLPESVSLFLQHRYNQLLSPFIYQGSRDDVKKSARLYADFFDTPLQKAERKSVRHALQSTAIVDQAKAGLLNINQKKVWLEKQEVTVESHGDWADVEIHEVYKNQTTDVEEILYYFSLPESAAITGLWLGETENKAARFPFQVSPRGAAQEVYNSQVRRTRPVDPALLEQVGSGQYRLRAFPVPPRMTARQIRRGESQPRMHLWLTYKVMRQENGWALPKLAEKRNIFWTRGTKRIRNGARKRFFGDVWLEDMWATEEKAQPTNSAINLLNGYQIAIKPLSEENYS
ncbi:MAG: TIGR02921 family PEP-CTERM protein [Pleurocapsa sp.]